MAAMLELPRVLARDWESLASGDGVAAPLGSQE